MLVPLNACVYRSALPGAEWSYYTWIVVKGKAKRVLPKQTPPFFFLYRSDAIF